GGSANTINISSVPPIAAYPAIFTLVSYTTGSSGNFTLGTLPSASPAFAGSVLDLGNGVVQLRLTSGPVADLTERWTGNNDNNWDTSPFNWLFHGVPTNFFSSAAVIFDDSSTQTNVNLNASLDPSTMTVSNNTVVYDFAGPGNIAGASSLI